MGMIADTSAIVALEHAWSGGRKLPLDEDEDLRMPAIVWAEALVGVRRADSTKRAANRLAVLENVRRIIGVEPFTAATAGHYADICAELAAEGLMIPQNDISVAATARYVGFGVLVGPKDEAHFRRVKGLEVRVLEV